MKENLQMHSYTLTALSNVILSPRSSIAYYRDTDYDPSVLAVPYNVIYPFYQYGEYEQYNKDANYYIPGSSVKGAVLRGKETDTLYFDDADVACESIDFASIVRAQYIEFLFPEEYKLTEETSGHMTAFKPFFESTTGIQCMKADSVASSKVYYGGELLKKVIEPANAITRARLDAYIKQLDTLSEKAERIFGESAKEKKQVFITNLSVLKENITKLNEDTSNDNLIFLGGYKGLLRSTNRLSAADLYKRKTDSDDYFDPISSAINVDASTKISSSAGADSDEKPIHFDNSTLPYGIVKIAID